MKHRLPLLGFLALIALLALAPIASAAQSFAQGTPLRLSLGTVSSAYQVDWYSTVDGYLGTGSPITVTTLSVGNHSLEYYLFRVRDGALLYQGAVDVTIVARAPSGQNPPATTTQVAPGEFEQITKMFLGCPDSYLVDNMYPAMLKGIAGRVAAEIYVDNTYARNDLQAILDRAGVARSAYTFTVIPVDTIWMRDYGPLFTRKNGALEVVDLDYYAGRDNDDAVPAAIAREHGWNRTALPLAWEGGNFTSDGRGNLYATDWLVNGNSDRTSTEVRSLVERAFGGTLQVMEHQLNDGGTQHLDMFTLMLGKNDVLVSKFPTNHQNYARMERNAAKYQGLGFNVRRVSQANTTYRSYTNGLIINDLALVPSYVTTTPDRAAVDAYAAAGYRTATVDCRKIIAAAGAIHCITITVPK